MRVCALCEGRVPARYWREPGGKEIKRKRRRKIANIEFYYFFDVLHREYQDLDRGNLGILFAIAISVIWEREWEKIILEKILHKNEIYEIY